MSDESLSLDVLFFQGVLSNVSSDHTLTVRAAVLHVLFVIDEDKETHARKTTAYTEHAQYPEGCGSHAVSYLCHNVLMALRTDDLDTGFGDITRRCSMDNWFIHFLSMIRNILSLIV